MRNKKKHFEDLRNIRDKETLSKFSKEELIERYLHKRRILDITFTAFFFVLLICFGVLVSYINSGYEKVIEKDNLALEMVSSKLCETNDAGELVRVYKVHHEDTNTDRVNVLCEDKIITKVKGS